MKKIYSLITLLVMLCATTASAQIQSVTELFGKYHFTATADVKDASMSEYFSNDCEVVISADPQNIFPGLIKGLAGASGIQDIYGLTSEGNGIIIRNPNGNYDVWGHGLYMANADGHNPYYGKQDETYSNIVYSYDAATKTFTLPDFTLVTCDDWNAQQANIVVKFTNVKMVQTEGETIVVDDMSSDYHFTCGTGAYDFNHDSDFPTEFDLKLTATNATFTEYTAEMQIAGYNKLTLPAKFDGQSMVFTLEDAYIDDAKTLYIGSLYGGSTSGTFRMMKAGQNLSMSSGLTIYRKLTPATEEDPTYENVQWYLNGIAKNLNAKEEEKVDYAGTYTTTATLAMDMTEGQAPVSGDIEIVYNEGWNMYLITKFFGLDVDGLNQGGILFTPDPDDPKKGTIDCADGYSELKILGELPDGNMEYWTLRDGNLSQNAIPVTFDNEGNFTIGEFTIAKIVYDKSTNSFKEDGKLAVWYSNLTATKQKEEPKPTIDLAGKYNTSAVISYDYGHSDYPTSGSAKIEYDDYWGIYLMSELFGFDLYTLNYGGLELTLDAENPHKATLSCGEINTIEAGKIYWSLRDMNAQDNPLDVTIDDDGTITIHDVCIVVTEMDSSWNLNFKEGYAYYSSIVLTKDDGTGISNVSFVPVNKKDGIYGIDGKVRSTLGKGYNIVMKNGEAKTIFVK